MKAFQARAKRTGVKPAPLLSRPRLKRQDSQYLDAYYTLSAARSAGFGGPQPIQLSELVAYLDLIGVRVPRERLKYMKLVQRLDLKYLEHAREQIAQQQSANAKSR